MTMLRVWIVLSVLYLVSTVAGASSLAESLGRVDQQLTVNAQLAKEFAALSPQLPAAARKNAEIVFETASVESALRSRDADRHTRIVQAGGVVLDGDAYPFIVGLAVRHPITQQFSIICGGSVIADKKVLTAAHCNGVPAKYLYVYVGPPVLDWSAGNLRQATQVTNHPGFERVRNAAGETIGLRNDVAIVDVSAPLGRQRVTLASAVQPQDVSTAAIVLGWGTTNTATGATSDLLLYGNVPVRTSDVCKQAYPVPFDDSQLCAGSGGTDSCWGDSGGPLIDATSRVQIGVVSYGTGCGLSAYPGVYAKVAALRSFIDPYLALEASAPGPWRVAW